MFINFEALRASVSSRARRPRSGEGAGKGGGAAAVGGQAEDPRHHRHLQPQRRGRQCRAGGGRASGAALKGMGMLITLTKASQSLNLILDVYLILVYNILICPYWRYVAIVLDIEIHVAYYLAVDAAVR